MQSILFHYTPSKSDKLRNREYIRRERTRLDPNLLDSTRFDAIGVQAIPIDANLVESSLSDEIVVRWTRTATNTLQWTPVQTIGQLSSFKIQEKEI